MVFNKDEAELLDVVDEKDNIIDTQSRNIVHNKGLLHREVHIWFFNKDKNIFFQKRGSQKSSGGLLDATVGGHVDKGEDYMQAAIREVKEEIGISINTSDLILIKKFREKYIDKNKNTINNFYRSIYVYKYPISEYQIEKEKEVVGVDFKKFSIEFLQNVPEEERGLFDTYILTDEISEIIQHVKYF